MFLLLYYFLKHYDTSFHLSILIVRLSWIRELILNFTVAE
jgi:hypothetical protein